MTPTSATTPAQGAEPRRPSRGLLAAVMLAPVLFGMAAYQSAFSAGFVFDDHLFLGQWCWQIDDPSELLDVLSRPGCTYRPLRYLSYAADHLLWGLEPFGYHLTNVLLHGLVAGLVVLLLRRLGVGAVAASLGALLWALHPVHTDVVTYVAGRRDLLAAAFFLLALLAWPRTVGRPLVTAARVVLGVGFFALALASKEMAVTLPVILALALLYRSSLRAARAGEPIPSPLRALRNLGGAQLVGLVVVLAMAGAFVYDAAILEPMTHARWGLWGGDVPHHLMTIPVVWAKYAELVVAPFGLYGDYSDYPPAAGLGDPRVWLGIALLLGVFAGALWQSGRRPYLSLGLLWLGVTLLPVSQLRPHHELLAEHYLYLPLIGLAIAAARGLERALATALGRRWVPWVVAGLSVTWLVTIAERNADFADEESFARALLADVPHTLRGRLTLAHALQRSGELDEALELLEFVLAHAEGGSRFHRSALQNIVTTYAAAARLEESATAAFALLRDYPRDSEGLRVLGTVRARQGLPGKGVVYLERALQASPLDVETHLHLGVTLMRLGRVDEAEGPLSFAAARWRSDADAQLQWALVPFARGDYSEAGRRLERVLALDSDNLYALERLFIMAQRSGDRAAACRWMQRLRPLRSDLARIRLDCDPRTPL